MKKIIVILLCLASVSAFAQKEIKIEEAKNRSGDSVKICNKIYGGKFLENSKSELTLMDFGAKYPNSLMTLVIENADRNLFKPTPELYYKDKAVCVTGVIKVFKEKAEIVLHNPSQITEMVYDKLQMNEPQ